MKTADRKIALIIAIVCFVLSCGQSRDVETTQTEPNAVVFIDHSVHVRAKTITEEEVKRLSPTAVRLDAKIAKTADGYLLILKWEIDGSSPYYWDVERYSDLDNGTDDDSNYNETSQVFEQEYTSVPLAKDRLYKFVLIGQVKSMTPGVIPEGSVVYKTIRVNLKGMP